jgi:hypothetical protein
MKNPDMISIVFARAFIATGRVLEAVMVVVSAGGLRLAWISGSPRLAEHPWKSSLKNSTTARRRSAI